MPTGKTGSRQFKTFICEYCHKPFTRYISVTLLREQKFAFCSPYCRNKARRKYEETRPCLACGKLFFVNCPTQKYCSRACLGKSQQRPRPQPKPKRNLFSASDLQMIQARYSSEGAASLASELHHSIGAIQNQAYKLGLKLEPQTFRMRVHEAARGYMKKHNPMKNPQVKAKVIATRNKRHPGHMQHLRILAQQSQSKYKPTKPERLLQSILTELKVGYEPGAIIKPSFVVDIKINRLIIQVDGEYWHGHPRFEPLTERQLKQKQRDAAQDKYLHACGYKVIRLWENQITRDGVYKVLKENSIIS